LAGLWHIFGVRAVLEVIIELPSTLASVHIYYGSIRDVGHRTGLRMRRSLGLELPDIVFLPVVWLAAAISIGLVFAGMQAAISTAMNVRDRHSTPTGTTKAAPAA
jgi:hypothetical protein